MRLLVILIGKAHTMCFLACHIFIPIRVDFLGGYLGVCFNAKNISTET
jgi:hypothetical protein